MKIDANTIIGICEIFAILLAGAAIWQSRNESRANHNLQVILQLSESFRQRWESRWEDALIQAEQSKGKLKPDVVKNIRHMLNWIDWFGTLIRQNQFTDPNSVLASLRPTFLRIINVARPVIVADTSKHGTKYWESLFIVAKLLEINWVTQLLDNNM